MEFFNIEKKNYITLILRWVHNNITDHILKLNFFFKKKKVCLGDALLLTALWPSHNTILGLTSYILHCQEQHSACNLYTFPRFFQTYDTRTTKTITLYGKMGNFVLFQQNLLYYYFDFIWISSCSHLLISLSSNFKKFKTSKV